MLIEVVVDMTDAWNEPRLTVALGAVPVLDKECNVAAVAPIPSPTEPRPMATLAQAARLRLDAALRQPSVYLLVDLRADPFDQPLGQGIVVLVTQFAMRGGRRRDVLMCTYVHKSKVCRDRWPG